MITLTTYTSSPQIKTVGNPLEMRTFEERRAAWKLSAFHIFQWPFAGSCQLPMSAWPGRPLRGYDCQLVKRRGFHPRPSVLLSRRPLIPLVTPFRAAAESLDALATVRLLRFRAVANTAFLSLSQRNVALRKSRIVVLE